MDPRRWRTATALAAVATLAIGACTPAPGSTARGPTSSPALGAPAPQRGVGGTLRIRWPAQVTTLNSYFAQSSGDITAAGLVTEPLAVTGPDGKLLPVLAVEVPTVENGGMARDFTSATWKLKPNVKWSDGTEFTSADVVFTWKLVADRAAGALFVGLANGVRVEALDRLAVKVTYVAPTPELGGLARRDVLHRLFVGSGLPILQELQFTSFLGASAKSAPGNQRPVGTGPYRVKEFRANDVVTYEVNEHYRDPARPFFSEVIFKTGGDAVSLARAAFQTGEADFSWNLAMLDGDVLRPMIDAPDSKAVLVTWPNTAVERVLLNRANPDPALGDQRSEPDQPHPFLSDLRVRRALAMAVDRGAIAALYAGGLGAEPTCNIVVGAPSYTSQNTASDPLCRLDLGAAGRLLDDAGWPMGADGIRQRAGVRMRILFSTTLDAVRQRTQTILKDAWSKIGVQTELRMVAGGVFFGREGPDTSAKFFADAEMFANAPDSADPTGYLRNWTTAEIRTRAANWSGANYERWSNSEYDDLYAQLKAEGQRDKRDQIVIRMNDMVVRDVVVIPLVARKAAAGVAKSLRGYIPNAWEAFWNIADWRR